TFEAVTSFEEELLEEFKHEHEHHHHDDDDDDDDECCCGHHHHDDDDDDDEHEHHHHHDHDHDHDHEHEHHHHDHGDSCSCGCHDHDHHHHHADEVFTSIGLETASKYTKADVEAFLEALEDDSKYGYVLRAKGMLASEGNKWIYFDYTPGEINVREGSPEYTGKICVIGSELKEDAIKALIIK
ncbi:MAG: GTP-binding protein, partial [Lachnospiraceae bacterium]|nr:GTP-binding protein [Lachnospiraceae bacterium]